MFVNCITRNEVALNMKEEKQAETEPQWSKMLLSIAWSEKTQDLDLEGRAESCDYPR